MKHTILSRSVIATLLAALVVLNGCAAQRFGAPVEVEAALPGRAPGDLDPGAVAAGTERWWHDFHDPALNRLIDLALRSNTDLADAATQLLHAQADARRIAAGPPAPGAGGSAASRAELSPAASDGAASRQEKLLERLSRTGAADDPGTELGEADRQGAELALVGTAASLYWEIAFLNERTAALQEQIVATDKLKEFVDRRFAGGAAPVTDQVKGRQAVADLRVEQTRLLERRTQARHALSLLFRRLPEATIPERQRLPEGELPPAPAALPASGLAQRPELRAAERRLWQYLLKLDDAATLYPAMVLTTPAGAASPALRELLQQPGRTLGAGTALPYLDPKSVKLLLDRPNREYEQAVADFRGALHSALKELSAAVSLRSALVKEETRLGREAEGAREAAAVAELRYRTGLVPLQAWLDAQEHRRQLEWRLAENRLNRVKNLMAIHLALGGPVR